MAKDNDESSEELTGEACISLAEALVENDGFEASMQTSLMILADKAHDLSEHLKRYAETDKKLHDLVPGLLTATIMALVIWGVEHEIDMDKIDELLDG